MSVLEAPRPAPTAHSVLLDCEQVGHGKGLAAGLAAALDIVWPPADGGTPAPAGPVAALPADRVAPGAEVLPHWMASLEGVAFVRCAPAPAEAAERLTAFGAVLGAARIGVSRHLLERAVQHLSDRTVEGQPTIRKQLVLGTLADVLTGVEAARRALLAAGSMPAAVADVHDRITELDWETAKLLGASGMITDSPSRSGYVSRLVANCWIPREDGAL